MMAVVLGTALTTLSPSAASGHQASPGAPRALSDLSRYCTVCWRNARLPADSWNDCTQEVLCRLLQRVPTESWDRALKAESDEHREFVRAIDAVKKRTQRRKRWTSQALDVVADRRDGQRRLDDDRAAVRKAAADLLSERQQRIVQLSLEGWSVQEIGAKLDMPPQRVSDEKYKAVRKLRSHLAESA